MIKKQNSYLFYKSIDLALLTLQTFDIYSYHLFFEELKKYDNSNKLIFLLFEVRFQSQFNLIYKSSKKNKFFIENKILPQEKKIFLLIFSKILNSKFCKQKFNFIYFYFLPEYSLFINKLKSNDFKKLKGFDFWIFSHQKRFNFLFLNIISKSFYNKQNYNYYLLIDLQNGLRYLNFYKTI